MQSRRQPINPSHVATAQSVTLQARESSCHRCQKTGHWKQKCNSQRRQPQVPRHLAKSQSQCRPKRWGMADEVGVLEGDLTFDEVIVHAWLADQRTWSRSPSDISIDVMIEAFAAVDMPVTFKKRASIWCKVDAGAEGNVMTLQTFAKLFPNQSTKTGMPTGL